jgi:hypothetical protein
MAGNCSVCGKLCLPMCPYCKAYVHEGFGFRNENCSGRHEEVCNGARDSRKLDVKVEPEKKPKLKLKLKARR